MCLIDAVIFSHSGNGPWVGLPNGTQIFTIDTNIFISTSMQAWACKVGELSGSVIQGSDIIIALACLAGSSASQLGSQLLR